MQRDEEQEFTHESYALVSFNRITGGGKRRLFGSSISNHPTTIILRVLRGRLQHNLHQDWYFGSGRTPLIEIELSAAQFTELLTTMNMGDGVPGTIRCFDGKAVENPPDILTEPDRIRETFATQMSEVAEHLVKLSEQMQTILAKKSLSKEDRRQIQWIVDKAIQEVQSNAPFAAHQFQEAAQKVVTAAKAEIDHFITTMVHKTGIEALQKLQDPLLLSSGDEDDRPTEKDADDMQEMRGDTPSK